jgi:hypothetical protein
MALIEDIRPGRNPYTNYVNLPVIKYIIVILSVIILKEKRYIVKKCWFKGKPVLKDEPFTVYCPGIGKVSSYPAYMQ